MITGNGTLSLRKRDLENQKVPAVGFRKTTFAHKTSAGATGINLSALTVPAELTANGFSQPSAADLTNAQLLFYRNNLKLISSLRGVLMDFVSYTVASSTQINFLGFTALEGEIFYGIIDYNAQTGIKVVDASPIVATGSLAPTTTDFNTGVPFSVNKYASQNVGAVLVYSDRAIQQRNTGNSSSVKDKDYYEVDSGAGLGTIIRFNSADPDNAREITIVSNGILSERPDGSMMAVIETSQGYIDNIAAVVAALSGLPVATVKGAAPTNVDLKNFGDRVLTLETNRARTDLSNTWTAVQPFVGVSDGSSALTGQIGEYKENFAVAATNYATTTANISSVDGGVSGVSGGTTVGETGITLTAGDWDIEASVFFQPVTMSALTGIQLWIGTATGNSGAGRDISRNYAAQSWNTNAPVNTDIAFQSPKYRVSLTASTTFYAKVSFSATGTITTINGRGGLCARRVR